MNCIHNAGDYAFAGRRGNNGWIRRYNRPNDRLLKLLADVHHPSETAKYVGNESPIHFINAKHLLHYPSAEIRVGRDSQSAAAAGFLDSFNERELIYPLNHHHAFDAFLGDLHLSPINGFE